MSCVVCIPKKGPNKSKSKEEGRTSVAPEFLVMELPYGPQPTLRQHSIEKGELIKWPYTDLFQVNWYFEDLRGNPQHLKWWFKLLHSWLKLKDKFKYLCSTRGRWIPRLWLPGLGMTEQHWKLNLEHKHIEVMTNKKSLQTMNWGSLGPACIPIQFKPACSITVIHISNTIPEMNWNMVFKASYN